jgi:hypothetical protein
MGIDEEARGGGGGGGEGGGEEGSSRKHENEYMTVVDWLGERGAGGGAGRGGGGKLQGVNGGVQGGIFRLLFSANHL